MLERARELLREHGWSPESTSRELTFTLNEAIRTGEDQVSSYYAVLLLRGIARMWGGIPDWEGDPYRSTADVRRLLNVAIQRCGGGRGSAGGWRVSTKSACPFRQGISC